MIDNSPGSPDGPPIMEPPTTGERLGVGFAICCLIIMTLLMVTAGLWALAWMITNFPGL